MNVTTASIDATYDVDINRVMTTTKDLILISIVI